MLITAPPDLTTPLLRNLFTCGKNRSDLGTYGMSAKPSLVNLSLADLPELHLGAQCLLDGCCIGSHQPVDFIQVARRDQRGGHSL